MAISTITSRGRITIPKEIRDQLRLRTGNKIDFRVEKGGSLRAYPKAKRVADVFGFFAHKATKRHSASAIKRDLHRAFLEERL